MKLLIERGQLLKPYSVPWSPDGWTKPADWTPERTPAMTAAYNTMQTHAPDVAPFVLWEKVEFDEGQRLQRARRPWPGWVMVPSPFAANATKQDRRISRAYRVLYSELNEEYSDFIDNGLRPPAGVKLVQVPDGRYKFRGGKMEQC